MRMLSILSQMVLPGIREGVHKLVFWGGRDHVASLEGTMAPPQSEFLMEGDPALA